MNDWFDRLRAAVLAELGDAVGNPDPARAAALSLTPEDAKLLLDLARDAAHGSGARQYAPLATYLAGRLVEREGAGADPAARARLIAAIARAAEAAGPAGAEPL